MEILAKTCQTERMNVERIVARVFVAAGGVFWTAAGFGADYVYRGESLTDSVGSAFLPLLIATFALVLGWFYEVLGGLALLGGAVAVAVWGVVAGWEAGVWLVNSTVLIAPMVIAGALYLLAARMQRICALEETGTR